MYDYLITLQCVRTTISHVKLGVLFVLDPDVRKFPAHHWQQSTNNLENPFPVLSVEGRYSSILGRFFISYEVEKPSQASRVAGFTSYTTGGQLTSTDGVKRDSEGAFRPCQPTESKCQPLIAAQARANGQACGRGCAHLLTHKR